MNLDSNAWRKANFHSHTRAWLGLTAASSSPVDEVAKKYRELKYDVIGISDYQSVNHYLESEKLYIPVYEHGYGMFKNHQLVIGAESVSWYDFLFFQSFSNLQAVINNLKTNNNVISINHPKLRDAYPPEKLKFLRGIDLIEIVNHSFFNAADLWDTLLSNGNPVFAIANDDNHDINDPEDFGYAFNMINSTKQTKEEVLKSLKNGSSFAVELEPQNDSSPQHKLLQANSIPILRSCKIYSDTLEMCFNKDFDTIKLIGQNGVVKKKETSDDTIKYVFHPGDTYIRAEINQHDQANVFLNPVIRYSGELRREPAEIDIEKTWLYRVIYILAAGAFLIFYLRYRK